MSGSGMRMVPAGCGDLALTSWGDPASAPLLMLHGVARRGDTFTPLLPWLVPEWRVAAVDHRGHGRSSRADSYLVRDYAADAVMVVERQFDRPVVLYGHSLGALVAVVTAAAIPRRVAAIVLEDPPGPGFLGDLRHSVYHGLFAAYRLLAGQRRPVVDLARSLADVELVDPSTGTSTRLGAVRDAAALRFLAACLADLDPAVMTPLVAGDWLTACDLSAALAAVRCPVLMLRADPRAGGMLPDADSRLFTGRLRDLAAVDLPLGTGHTVHGTSPELVIRHLLPFLATIGRPR